ncbi:hypothetical protein P691DRAFT_810950 [Macrolepiota fuliginosa MF-IS2]|uniref:Uncharacterized protein n=1 Tax=Macrolepiota fuliginosa MF-IS2 TaxID=1400762 RepID=A0A9P5XI52_9AGAR|nr:hypothetical protein P691DRAFT_810950 [Macrolepiota fuliginosa MF-IS2]
MSPPKGDAPPSRSKPLDIYMAEVVHKCQVPNIVPYATLYILASISRSCACPPHISDSPISGVVSVDLSPTPHATSALAHTISEAFTKSPFCKVRKSHWSGRHVFMGPFLVALRVFERFNGSVLEKDGIPDFDWSELAAISRFSKAELDDLEKVVYDAMDEQTREDMTKMIRDNVFLSLKDIQCIHTVMRRQKLSEMRKGLEEAKMVREVVEGGSTRRLFRSVKRARGEEVSMLLEEVDGMPSKVTVSVTSPIFTSVSNPETSNIEKFSL